MKFFQQRQKHVLLIICVTVVACICIKGIVHLFFYKNSIEFFSDNNTSIPLTIPYNCDNFCGPNARCAITGQQCTADMDCPGCLPPTNSLPKVPSASVRGNNDAGKLGISNAGSFSKLTTDIGTQSKLYDAASSNLGPIHPNLGKNTWITNYRLSMNDFNQRYRPVGLEFIPNYKKTFTLSGEFSSTGPLPANAYL